MHIFSPKKRHNGGKKQIWRWQFLLTHIDSSLTVYTSFLNLKIAFHVQFISLHEPEPDLLYEGLNGVMAFTAKS